LRRAFRSHASGGTTVGLTAVVPPLSVGVTRCGSERQLSEGAGVSVGPWSVSSALISQSQ